jgi:hypothetical protein
VDDFQKYEKLRDKGASPKEVYLAAKHDGLDWPALIRLLRKVFSLSFAEAKEVSVIGDGLAPSLKEHQRKFVPALRKLLEEENNSKHKKQGGKSGV